MTKKFRAFTTITIIILIAFGIFTYINIKQYPISDGLPKFTFFTLANSKFTNENLPHRPNYVILYFSPDCDYCFNEINDITKNRKLFKNTFFVMVSPSPLSILRDFDRSIQHSKLNYIILLDKNYSFGKFFGPSSIPSTFIYSNKKLVGKNQGGVTAKFIHSKL